MHSRPQCSRSLHSRRQPSLPTRAHGKVRQQNPIPPARVQFHCDAHGSAYEHCEPHCNDGARNEFPCCRQPAPQCMSTHPIETCSSETYSDPCVREVGAPCAPTCPRASTGLAVMDSEPPEPAPNRPVPILVSAAPVDLPGSGTLVCVVFFLAVMFIAAIVVQIYLMHVNSYPDPFLARFQDYEKVDSPQYPQDNSAERKESSMPTEPTVPWKVNPGFGSRPHGSVSRRPHVYSNVGRSTQADDDRSVVGGRKPSVAPPPQLLRDYPLLLRRDYQGESKSICMFHATSSGRTRNGIHYKPWNFPYHLCTHVVYCCAGITAELEVISRHVDIDINEGFIASFTAMKMKNPYLRVYIGVGSDDRDRTAFAKIVASVGMRQQFAQNAVTWMRRAQYDGMVLYWKYPFMEQKAKLVDTMRYLRQALHGMDLTVGIVVPLDEMLRDRFNVSELSRLLDDYTILIDPIDTQGGSYDSTFVPFRDGTVRMYAGVFMSTLRHSSAGDDKTNDGRFQLCYMFPVNAVSFTLERAAQTEINAPTVGPGEPGRSTEVPGALAYDEVCSQTWESTRRVNYGVVSTRGNQWVVYQNRSSLHELMTALGYVTGPAKCFGIWDPFWDDFAGACGEGPYPLTRAIFAKVVGHKIPFKKKSNLGNLL
ncbi:chitinase-3-like protein 1 [Dermacentor albipictus]|uniref:chitinase-3-like protein 1 n=1 Tax=Dermacentor albipictus TaxID=60249 RepID=UPI0031FDC7CC